MILDTILQDANWTPYGIQFSDEHTAKVAHKFLREAILDRHLYITKAIGFKITSGTSYGATSTYISRHKQIGESYLEIVHNMFDKVFMCTDTSTLQLALTAGLNNLPDNAFINKETKEKVHTLFTNPETARCLDKTATLTVEISYGSGYHSMAENSKLLHQSFFPCDTDYSAHEFFRILPIVRGNMVQVRYYNDATQEMLMYLLSMWRTFIQTKQLSEVDSKWLLNFMR